MVILLIYTGQHMAYPFIPLYILRQGGSPLQIGMAFLVNLALAALLSVPMGRLSDRYGRRRIISMGCVLSVVGHLLIPLLRDPLLIIAAFSLAGAGHAAYGPSLQALIGDMARRGRVATAFGITQTARQATLSIGPALGGFVGLLGLRYIFFTAAFFFSAAPIAAALLLAPLLKHREDERVRREQGKVSEVFSIIMNPYLMLAVFSTFAVGYSNMALRSFLPVYIQSLGGDTAVIGLIFTAQALVAMLARLPIARYVDVSGKRESLIALGVLSAALLISLITLAPSIVYVAAIFAALAFFLSFGGVVPWVIIAERTSASSRGAAMGINNAMLYAGQGIGSALTGVIIQSLSFAAGFSAISMVLLVVGAAYGALIMHGRQG